MICPSRGKLYDVLRGAPTWRQTNCRAPSMRPAHCLSRQAAPGVPEHPRGDCQSWMQGARGAPGAPCQGSLFRLACLLV